MNSLEMCSVENSKRTPRGELLSKWKKIASTPGDDSSQATNMPHEAALSEACLRYLIQYMRGVTFSRTKEEHRLLGLECPIVTMRQESFHN